MVQYCIFSNIVVCERPINESLFLNIFPELIETPAEANDEDQNCQQKE